MVKRITVSRAAAVRTAQEAKARRDAERRRREQDVEAALADFYESTARAAALREQARVRAERMVEQAELAATEPERAAHAAVVRMHELGESREQIADLTGLRLVEVRALLTEAERAGSPEPTAARTAADVAARPAPDVAVAATADEPVAAGPGSGGGAL
jgi:hypothetical protein